MQLDSFAPLSKLNPLPSNSSEQQPVANDVYLSPSTDELIAMTNRRSSAKSQRSVKDSQNSRHSLISVKSQPLSVDSTFEERPVMLRQVVISPLAMPGPPSIQQAIHVSLRNSNKISKPENKPSEISCYLLDIRGDFCIISQQFFSVLPIVLSDISSFMYFLTSTHAFFKTNVTKKVPTFIDTEPELFMFYIESLSSIYLKSEADKFLHAPQKTATKTKKSSSTSPVTLSQKPKPTTHILILREEILVYPFSINSKRAARVIQSMNERKVIRRICAEKILQDKHISLPFVGLECAVESGDEWKFRKYEPDEGKIISVCMLEMKKNIPSKVDGADSHVVDSLLNKKWFEKGSWSEVTCVFDSADISDFKSAIKALKTRSTPADYIDPRVESIKVSLLDFRTVDVLVKHSPITTTLPILPDIDSQSEAEIPAKSETNSIDKSAIDLYHQHNAHLSHHRTIDTHSRHVHRPSVVELLPYVHRPSVIESVDENTSSGMPTMLKSRSALFDGSQSSMGSKASSRHNHSLRPGFISTSKLGSLFEKKEHESRTVKVWVKKSYTFEYNAV